MVKQKIAILLCVLFLFSALTTGCHSKTSTSQPLQQSEYQFVGSIHSNKYHYPTCEWAQKIKPENRIWFKDKADARAQGYVPCKVCSPP
ncbi:MAG TPA: hypothetical protein GXX19_02045 [Syntrophomonadaceae bacterium]|nr:hypothetical protein [Syntrophomonadaceae bacterium]